MAVPKPASPPMDIDEFRAWADGQPGKWELVDGFPRAMAPASSTHALIMARAAALFGIHLDATRSKCRVATEPPVIPATLRRHNARAPDLAITCSPPKDDGWELKDPVFLLEILSPTNEIDTWNNVWTYMTMPTVRQVLLLHTERMRGEMLRRGRDGSWPAEPEILGPEDEVRIEALDFARRVKDFYVSTNLAG